MSDGSIKEIDRSSRIPSGILADINSSQIKRGDSLASSKTEIWAVETDNHFISAYGINLLAGRGFSNDFGPDTSAFIINEAAVREMGFKTSGEVIGREFQYGERKGQLIGVVKDFHFESMHRSIKPIVFYKAPVTGGYNFISVKVLGENVAPALAKLEKTWNTFDSGIPFDYSFIDDRFARLYESEERQGKVFTLFASIAITIACLGLFGLSAFTISQRVKEIGIRKVLGAENASIVALLSKDFLKLVGVAALIAFPVAWYAMNTWLQDFAYRIKMPLWVFFIAGVLAALVAFLTIGYQAIKAATANPVKNLRAE